MATIGYIPYTLFFAILSSKLFIFIQCGSKAVVSGHTNSKFVALVFEFHSVQNNVTVVLAMQVHGQTLLNFFVKCLGKKGCT